jgi:predicted nucleic acid-binding Zn ribbon protein
MDHLSQVAKAARECGMSYGRYVALQYERRGYRPEQRPQEEPDGAERKRPEQRKCVICGNPLPFGALKHKATCSSQCSLEMNRKNSRECYQKFIKFKPEAPVKCAHCGEEFWQNRKAQRFCCKKCQDDYQYAKTRTIKGGNSMKDRNYGMGTCAVCGAEYLKRSSRQKTCSRTCSDRLYNEKRRKGKKC